VVVELWQVNRVKEEAEVVNNVRFGALPMRLGTRKAWRSPESYVNMHVMFNLTLPTRYQFIATTVSASTSLWTFNSNITWLKRAIICCNDRYMVNATHDSIRIAKLTNLQCLTFPQSF